MSFLPGMTIETPALSEEKFTDGLNSTIVFMGTPKATDMECKVSFAVAA
jgi:hypothetical protein